MKMKKNILISCSLVGLTGFIYQLKVSQPQLLNSAVAAVKPASPDSAVLGEPKDLNIFVSLAKKAIPSVVNISTLSTVKAAYRSNIPDDLFREFFGLPSGPNFPRVAPKAAALGSGFILNSSGIILTNNHVIANADQIKIQFTESPDEKPTDGKVIGRDPELDVALIQVKTNRKLIPLPLGDSEALQVGEYVMAAGNPFGNGHSVSHGIVSAKGRLSPGIPLASYLQVDAPINPGNSGGPLLNLKGEVVGINNAIDARAQGIGFAIPINYVKKVLNQLEKNGSVQRGYIGAVVGQLTPEIAKKIGESKDLNAPFVTQIVPGTPAKKAGLQVYDVIKEVDGSAVHTPNELVVAITSLPVGKKTPLKISRNGKEQSLFIQTEPKPGSEVAKEEDSEEKPSTDFAGLELAPVGKGQGLIVKNVKADSPAAEAGLRRGDVILEVNRKEIKTVSQFADLIKTEKSHLLRVKRPSEEDGQSYYSVVLLNLGESPNEG